MNPAAIAKHYARNVTGPRADTRARVVSPAGMKLLGKGFMQVTRGASRLALSVDDFRALLALMDSDAARDGRRVEFSPPGANALDCVMFRIGRKPRPPVAPPACTAMRDYRHPCRDVGCEWCQEAIYGAPSGV